MSGEVSTIIEAAIPTLAEIVVQYLVRQNGVDLNGGEEAEGLGG